MLSAIKKRIAKPLDFVRENSDHGGADVVLEVAGAKNTFELLDLAAFRLRKGFSAIQTVRSVFHAGVSANVGFDRVDRYAQFISDGRGTVSVPIHTLQFPALKFIHHSVFHAFDSFHSRTGSRISGVRFRSSGRSDRSFYRRANSTLSG